MAEKRMYRSDEPVAQRSFFWTHAAVLVWLGSMAAVGLVGWGSMTTQVDYLTGDVDQMRVEVSGDVGALQQQIESVGEKVENIQADVGTLSANEAPYYVVATPTSQVLAILTPIPTSLPTRTAFALLSEAFASSRAETEPLLSASTVSCPWAAPGAESTAPSEARTAPARSAAFAG